MKRLLLYVHYNKYDQISNHVFYQLKAVRLLYETIVFISNSSISNEYRNKLSGYVDNIIQRENVGFDFGAWRDGMQYIGFDTLLEYDSVTLMNDTCFGPFYDIQPFYEIYETHGVDIWGMTNHRAYQVSKNHFLNEHIQSYFKVFSKKVISSDIFREFWTSIEDFSDIQDVIDNYEIQSTSIFREAGFNDEVILDTCDLDASHIIHPDFSFYAPDVILQEKLPFLKVKAFQGSENVGKYIIDYIGNHTTYPKEFIVEHLSIMNYPDINYLVAEKYLSNIGKNIITKKVAVHLHVFYTDLLEEFLDAFDEFHFNYDLYLTTNTNEKAALIKEILNYKQVEAVVVETPNTGRDILPFLGLKDIFQDYDIVGHFHTKRSLEASFFTGESWRKELIDMLIKPADNILSNFEHTSNLGIVIADIPTFFRLNRVVDADNENKMIAPIMNDIWNRMRMEKKVNFHDFTSFTMSYGTFFWARIEVMEPLFSLDIMNKEVPSEPLPQNTILHAIERILVYLAWDRNLDFRISKNKHELPAFIDVRTFNKRFSISKENAKDMRFTQIIKILGMKIMRILKYRTYQILGKNTKFI